MSSAFIVGAGVVTALGNLEATWQGLLQGCTGLGPAGLPMPLDRYPVGAIKGISAEYGSSIRLNKILDLLFEDLPVLPSDTPFVVSSTKAGVDELLGQSAEICSGQPWNLAAEIGKRLEIAGPQVLLSAACASGTLAVINAAQQLVLGESDIVLVVGVDLLSRFVLSGFARLQALSFENCRPFDCNRNGLALGEGAGYLLLATSEAAEARGWPILARVEAWGAACDAGHITAPSRDANGLLAALAACTVQKSLTVGAINAHGTGTKFNDAMELTAFTTFWD
ncbi:MAG: hypothetical protein A2511_04600, partial [Deltaproteobacteria bacterium RIFOXYD12_FULL_50_9]